MSERLFQVLAPHFTAGVVFDTETSKVVETAPILKWSIGWDFHRFKDYCKSKGYRILKVEQSAPE